MVNNLVLATPNSLPPSAKIRFSFFIEMLKKYSLKKKRRLTNRTIKPYLLSLQASFLIEWDFYTLSEMTSMFMTPSL